MNDLVFPKCLCFVEHFNQLQKHQSVNTTAYREHSTMEEELSGVKLLKQACKQ